MWNIPEEWLGPYLTSNAIILVLVAVAFFWPRIARYAFALMFLAASIANTVAVLRDPVSYLDYAQWTFSGLYESFITGFFSRHTIPIVLTIAAGQLCVALLLALGGRFWSLGALGAGVFFVAITPLGIGSAFPFTLLGIAALVIMVARHQRAARSTKDR